MTLFRKEEPPCAAPSLRRAEPARARDLGVEQPRRLCPEPAAHPAGFEDGDLFQHILQVDADALLIFAVGLAHFLDQRRKDGDAEDQQRDADEQDEGQLPVEQEEVEDGEHRAQGVAHRVPDEGGDTVADALHIGGEVGHELARVVLLEGLQVAAVKAPGEVEPELFAHLIPRHLVGDGGNQAHRPFQQQEEDGKEGIGPQGDLRVPGGDVDKALQHPGHADVDRRQRDAGQRQDDKISPDAFGLRVDPCEAVLVLFLFSFHDGFLLPQFLRPRRRCLAVFYCSTIKNFVQCFRQFSFIYIYIYILRIIC